MTRGLRPGSCSLSTRLRGRARGVGPHSFIAQPVLQSPMDLVSESLTTAPATGFARFARAALHPNATRQPDKAGPTGDLFPCPVPFDLEGRVLLRPGDGRDSGATDDYETLSAPWSLR